MESQKMEYPNTGALFRTKEKKHPKSPDMWGDIKFDKAFLLDLIEQSNDQVITIKLGGWTKEGKNGKFLSLQVDSFKKTEERVRQDAAPEDNDDLPF
jgi:hypothetical protein